MRSRAAVIGVGNAFRSDDGVGPAVIAALRDRGQPEEILAVSDGEPTQLLELWAGTSLAVVIDAVLCQPSTPGRVHRTDLTSVTTAAATASTHGLGLPDALRLAEVLDQAPDRLVVYAVEAADLGFGLGLSVPVADAVPAVVDGVLADLAGLAGAPVDAGWG